MRQGGEFSHKAPPAGTRQETAGHMPARGQQAFLLNLPHSLLQAGNAPTAARRDALCRTEDAAAPYGGNPAKEKEKLPCRINSFCACWAKINVAFTAPLRGCSQAP